MLRITWIACLNFQGVNLSRSGQISSVMGFDKLSPNVLKTARPEPVEGHRLRLVQELSGCMFGSPELTMQWKEKNASKLGI
jgi:hypothetical protein